MENRGYVLGEKAQLPPAEIVAFEFKLENWQRAFIKPRDTAHSPTEYTSYFPLTWSITPNGYMPHFGFKYSVCFPHDPEAGASRLIVSAKR